MLNMDHRERVIRAIEHKQPDRVPVDGGFRQDVMAKIGESLGIGDPEEIKVNLGLDIRYTMMEPGSVFAEKAEPSPWQIPDMGMGKQNLIIKRENGWLEDEYRICRVPNSSKLYWHYAYHPLGEAEQDDIMKYRFPDPARPERYASIQSDIMHWGNKYFTAVQIWNVFKTSWELRGFERYMMDLSLDPRLVEILADRALEHRIEQSKQLVRHGIDMLAIMGDIAMQNGMMLSPAMWRKYFKPRLKTWLEEVRRENDVYMMFHSDGNMEAVFDDIIEIGFDVIHPIQPECMDVEKLIKRYGSQVCLYGTISCQQTLPFGTPQEVAEEVKQRITVCGEDGGLILGPSNTVQPDVPVENILTLYQTARNMGK